MATNKKLLTAEPLPTLTSLLQGADVKLVEIGGRGSTFPDLVTLAPFAHYYVSEPDASEAARLADHLNGIGWRSVTVLTDAIGLACGDATLFHTAEPGMSSLLEPDPEVARRFYLRDKFRVVGTSTVSVTTLDEAALRYSFNDACFLKIDTQGTELDILRSGETLLRQSLLAVYVECSFRPFYRGQALFGEVDSYLRAQGLELFSLSRTNLRRADYPAGRYSRRVTAWAHCLYFREADTLVTAERSARRRLIQMLGLALAFQHFDLAIEALDLLKRGHLVEAALWPSLVGDVDACIARGTRHTLHKAREKGVDEAVPLAADFRDRKQVE